MIDGWRPILGPRSPRCKTRPGLLGSRGSLFPRPDPTRDDPEQRMRLGYVTSAPFPEDGGRTHLQFAPQVPPFKKELSLGLHDPSPGRPAQDPAPVKMVAAHVGLNGNAR